MISKIVHIFFLIKINAQGIIKNKIIKIINKKLINLIFYGFINDYLLLFIFF